MRHSPFSHILRVVLPYLVVSAVWILLSDRIAAALLPEVSQLSLAQTVKGLGFIVLSAFLIAWLLVLEQRRQAIISVDLAESQRRYRQSILNSPDPIFSVDRGGIIRSCNDACTALFNFERGLVGLHYDTLFANPDQSVTGLVQRVLDNGDTLAGVELSFRMRDGSQRDMVSRLYPIMGSSGEVVECVFANSDVTARRRAERRLSFQAKLLDNVREAVVAVDVDGFVIYWGAGAESLYGYRSGETLGYKVEQFGQFGAPDMLVEQTVEGGDEPASEGLWSGQIQQARQDGSTIWIDVTLAEITDGLGSVEGYISIARDISSRRRFEEEIRQRNRELALLNRVLTEASSSLHPEEVLDVACREMGLTFAAQRVTGSLITPDRRMLEFVVEYTEDEEAKPVLMGHKLPVDGSLASRYVFENRKTLVAPDALTDPYFADSQDILKQRGARSIMIIPMLLHGEIMGTIALNTSEPRTFTDDEVELAQSVASVIAQAVHNARLYNELQAINEGLVGTVDSRTTELEQIKNRVEAIVESSPDVILLLGESGDIQSANRASTLLFRRYTGLEGVDVLELVNLPDRKRLRQAFSTALVEGETVRLEVTGSRGDNTTFDADVAFAPVTGQDEPMVVATIRDISALKEVERMKDNFVSNVSHELRTPIASLKVYHNLIQHNTAKREIYMNRLAREIERLAGIIESLLTLSRIDQGRMPLRFAEVDLNRLLVEYVADRQPLAATNQLRLRIADGPELPPVRADAALLGQVLSILLTNAFNYTQAGGTVTVGSQLRLDDEGRQWVGFRVSDTGPGIVPDEEPYLFQRFFRGKAGQESGTPGTGLGLSIAEEIIQQHGGSIEVHSSGMAGEGASFTVWLPIQEVLIG